jgi:hypothetical protein
MNSLEEKYNTLMNDMIRCIPNNKYMFEVTKCCGYSTFVLVQKDASLIDLYKEIAIHFQCVEIKSLFLVSGDSSVPIDMSNNMCININNNNNQRRLYIPLTVMQTVRQLLYANQPYFKPIYPIPHHVVYRIYLDDGHHHISEECSPVFNEGL